MATRLSVKKTYKLYIGGKFPRTESGRSLDLKDRKGTVVAAYCHASRKDFRNAVVAAHQGLAAWCKATPYLRSQILYRAAEILESRRDAFIAELKMQGLGVGAARREVDGAIDRLVYYAGWADKYSQVFSSVNPVASSHFNFSIPEATGVVACLAPTESGLLGFVECIARVLVGGNTLVIVANEAYPLSAISLAEVFHSSDFPAGVVNILTGPRSEFVEVMARHMNVDGILAFDAEPGERKELELTSADNLKRLHFESGVPSQGDPYRIMDFQEIKTTWHPVATN